MRLNGNGKYIIKTIFKKQEEKDISTMSLTKLQTLFGFHQFFHSWSFFFPPQDSIQVPHFICCHVSLASSNWFLFLGLSLSLWFWHWKCIGKYLVHSLSIWFVCFPAVGLVVILRNSTAQVLCPQCVIQAVTGINTSHVMLKYCWLDFSTTNVVFPPINIWRR